MTHAEYLAYLQSYDWQLKREKALKRFGNRCAICNSPDHLQVHHRTYERLGDEAIGDLTVLCADCAQIAKSIIRH